MYGKDLALLTKMSIDRENSLISSQMVFNFLSLYLNKQFIKIVNKIKGLYTNYQSSSK